MLVAEQVALSDYLEEIGTQIRDHHAVEALALCKYVLRQFPKHLETYRLMASALVELGDTNGALDIYRRVLSADPESVDAYVGTARILDVRLQLDEALWYMERAFELAPTQTDIRQELLALYARAEGKPRGRLKLTRGALARLYVQEGLLPQAVREFREISQENPSRYDLRVALAEALWRTEQTRQAAEVAQSLLDPLPYCLKANLILGAAWRESAIEESEGFLQRAQALDPSNQVANRLLADRSPLPPVQIKITRYEDEEPPSPRPEGEKNIPGTGERMAIEETNFEIPPLVAPDQVAPAISFNEPPAELMPSSTTPETESALLDSAQEIREAEPGEPPVEAGPASESIDESSPGETEQEAESIASLQPTVFPTDEPSSSVEESVPEETAQEAEAGTAPHEEEKPTWLSGVPEESKIADKLVEEEEMPSWLDGAKAEASTSPEPATPEVKIPKWVEVLSQPRRDYEGAADKETRLTEPVAPTAIPESASAQETVSESEYYSRLVQARQHRDESRWSDAFADYDFVINKAPNLVGEVITDLEALVASGDPPLEAQRVLGDAYSRAGRLDDALESYRLLYRHLSELD